MGGGQLEDVLLAFDPLQEGQPALSHSQGPGRGCRLPPLGDSAPDKDLSHERVRVRVRVRGERVRGEGSGSQATGGQAANLAALIGSPQDHGLRIAANSGSHSLSHGCAGPFSPSKAAAVNQEIGIGVERGSHNVKG